MKFFEALIRRDDMKQCTTGLVRIWGCAGENGMVLKDIFSLNKKRAWQHRH